MKNKNIDKELTWFNFMINTSGRCNSEIETPAKAEVNE